MTEAAGATAATKGAWSSCWPCALKLSALDSEADAGGVRKPKLRCTAYTGVDDAVATEVAEPLPRA
eukprot:4418673-Prymnesium_polylepis.1